MHPGKAALLLITLLSLLTSCSSYEKAKANKLYVVGSIGTGVLGESSDEQGGVSISDQTMETATNLTGVLGYRFNIFALELMFASLGKPEIQFEDQYTETHDANFIGGGFHWTWNWFDLKVGYGNVKDTVKFENGPLGANINFDPKSSSTSSLGAYFGIGANFNLGKDTEFIFDYTGFAWEDDTKRSWTNGTASGSSDSKSNAYTLLSVGIRWFL